MTSGETSESDSIWQSFLKRHNWLAQAQFFFRDANVKRESPADDVSQNILAEQHIYDVSGIPDYEIICMIMFDV